MPRVTHDPASSADANSFEQQMKNIITTVTSPWPSFSGDQQTAFNTINGALKSKHGLQLWSDVFKIELGYIEAINQDPGIHHPDPGAWDSVVSLIEDTLGEKDAITEFFQGQSTYNLEVQQQQVSLTKAVAGYVQMADKNLTVSFPLGATLDILLSFIAFIPGVGGGLSGIAKAIVGRALAAISGNSVDPFAAQFSTTLATFEEQLQTQFANIALEQTNILNAVVRNYGKLKAATDLIDSKDVTWPQNITDLFTQAAINEAEIAVWKVLLPARWQIVTFSWVTNYADSQADVDRITQTMAKCWPQLYPNFTSTPIEIRRKFKLVWVYPSQLQGIATNYFDEMLDKVAAERLFDTLSVKRHDLFGQLNGWKFQAGSSPTLNKRQYWQDC